VTSVHFQRLRISDIRQETENAISLSFEIPKDLTDAFSFIQGQHLTLRANIDGEDLRRSYSICSAVGDPEIRVSIKRLAGGRFSNFAHQNFKVGDEIEVMPPLGRFYTELDPSQGKHYLALAAGIGITPIVSNIETTLRTEADSCFTLVYGNRNIGNIVFREQLDDIKNRYPERFHLVHILSQVSREVELLNGRIDGEKLKALTERLIDLKTVDEVFICGPQAMTIELRKTLIDELGIAAENVHIELFGVADEGQIRVITPDSKGPVRKVTVIADGKRTVMDLTTTGMPILDAALNAGADLPFACKGGVCSTCRAKLIEGEVSMDVQYALEEHEIEAGFILTCQSHPTTDHVVVDFDHG
jgi:ring-1,2-phenylacetyl-CoA epoxidase subunit PaaE